MAEIGGPSVDNANVNLDSTGNLPGTSNGPPKAGTLKRTADANGPQAANVVKKKKTAVERASTTKGRNQAIRQEIKEKKKKVKEQQGKSKNIESLLETRSMLLDKLQELGERDMEDDDKAEERAVKREEKFRYYLIQCDKALKKDNTALNANEEAVMKSVHITIENFSCLDSYVQDYAFDKFSADDPDHIMTTRELSDIIRKVKSRDSSIKFPKEGSEGFDRLHHLINIQIVEASKEKRFDNLDNDLNDYPGIELDALPKQVKMEDGEDRTKVIHKFMMNIPPDDGSEREIDVINLDDEEDREKEGDDDEMEDTDDDDGHRLNEEDNQLLARAKDCIDMDGDDTMVDLPVMQPKTAMKAMVEKTEEQKNEFELKEEEKLESRPDSRESKDTIEGGTSTNSPASPTLERDERMKNDEIKQETVPMEVDTAGKKKGNGNEGEASEEEKPTAWNRVANTIVLDEDEDGMEVQEMEPLPLPRRKVSPVEESQEETAAIGPPVAPKLNASDAWKEKHKYIQQWVDKLTGVPPEETKEEESSPLKRDDEDDDDGIVCLQDDFEFDSVSHSGLEFRKILKVADGGDVKPAVRVKTEKKEPSDEVEIIELD